MKHIISIYSLWIATLKLSFGAIITVHGPTAFSAAAPQTFLINQTFEGTGYDNSETWTTQAGTPAPDYTTTVLEGSQSLQMDGTAATVSADGPTFTAAGTLYFKFRFRPQTLPGGGREVLRFLLSGSQSGASELQIDASGRLVLFNGTNSVITSSGMSINTNYTVWGYWKAGSGANAEARIAWAPGITGSEVRPTSDGGGNGFASSTSLNGTANVDRIRITAQFSTTGPAYVMDKLQFSATDIP